MAAPKSFRLLLKKYWVCLSDLSQEEVLILKTLVVPAERNQLAVQNDAGAWVNTEKAGFAGYHEHLGLPGKPIAPVGKEILETLRAQAKNQFSRTLIEVAPKRLPKNSDEATKTTRLDVPSKTGQSFTAPTRLSNTVTKTGVASSAVPKPTAPPAKPAASLKPVAENEEESLLIARIPDHPKWSSAVLKLKKGSILLQEAPPDVKGATILRVHLQERTFEFKGQFAEAHRFLFDYQTHRKALNDLVEALRNYM